MYYFENESVMSSVLFSKDFMAHFDENGEITCSPVKTLLQPIVIAPEIT
jgi:hypothetical protein